MFKENLFKRFASIENYGIEHGYIKLTEKLGLIFNLIQQPDTKLKAKQNVNNRLRNAFNRIN